MLPRTVRGAVAVAAVVVEEVGKRVVETAAAVLEKTGVDVAEVERRLGGQFPPSAEKLQALAGEAFTAGRAGVDLAVGVARGEVEKVFEKVGDQVTKVGVVLAYLESKLSELEGEQPAAAEPEPDLNPYAVEVTEDEPAPAPRADDLFGRGWERDADEWAEEQAPAEPIAAERVEVDEPVEFDPPVTPVAPVAPVKRAAAARKAAAEQPAAEQLAAKKATAKKAAAKKATAKRTTVKNAAAAQPEAPVKRAASRATKKTTVRKATSRKQPDARDE
ncbi:hypothetical protein ACPC54_37140 [Kitasatospora sp. NPDC094028]